MTPILFIFFALYGLLHFYAFHKARAALALDSRASLLLGLFMIVMVLAPVIIRLSESRGFELFARIFSYTGYLWMGFLFLYVNVSLFFDLCRFILYVAGLVTKKDFLALAPSQGALFFASLLCGFIITVYGFMEARNIRIERLTIHTTKIPREIGTLRIAQISDVHLGLIVREARLERILKRVKDAEPDILVSTGDFVDGQINRLNGLAEILQQVKPRFGKFAITGNHEFYAGIDQALDFTRKAGFRVLRNEGLTIPGVINIAGIDDPAGARFGLATGVSERELLSPLDHGLFTLFLKHRPLIDRDAMGLFDLQLSGHVHKGQIFPFSILTKLYYPIHAGDIDVGSNGHLHVSRGSGTWGPPIRFLAPPEVTVIELVNR